MKPKMPLRVAFGFMLIAANKTYGTTSQETAIKNRFDAIYENNDETCIPSTPVIESSCDLSLNSWRNV